MTDSTTNIPDYPLGGHAFVWARPKDKNWDKFDGTNGLGDGPREFRPCMVVGDDTGKGIRVLGSQYGYRLDQFEVAGPCFMPEAFRSKPPMPDQTTDAVQPEPDRRSDLGPFPPVHRSSTGAIMDALDLAQRDGARSHLEDIGYKVVTFPDNEDRFLVDDEFEMDGEALIEKARDWGYSPPGYGL